MSDLPSAGRYRPGLRPLSESAEVQIRPATVDDTTAMLAIYAPVVRDTAVSFELSVPDHDEFRLRVERTQITDPWLVAHRGDEVIGYAYSSEFRARPAYERSRETTVYVGPGHHGAGVGRRLLVELLDALRQRGDRLAIAGIVLPNDASVGLHEALGFRYVGTFNDVGRKFDRWHDVGFWQRRLDVE